METVNRQSRVERAVRHSILHPDQPSETQMRNMDQRGREIEETMERMAEEQTDLSRRKVELQRELDTLRSVLDKKM